MITGALKQPTHVDSMDRKRLTREHLLPNLSKKKSKMIKGDQEAAEQMVSGSTATITTKYSQANGRHFFVTGVESFDVDLKELMVIVKGNVKSDAVLQTVSKTEKKIFFWEPNSEAAAEAPATEAAAEAPATEAAAEALATESAITTAA